MRITRVVAIVFLLVSLPAFGSTIRGRVVDSNKDALPGATVEIANGIVRFWT